jgi:hypothetical protein
VRGLGRWSGKRCPALPASARASARGPARLGIAAELGELVEEEHAFGAPGSANVAWSFRRQGSKSRRSPTRTHVANL